MNRGDVNRQRGMWRLLYAAVSVLLAGCSGSAPVAPPGSPLQVTASVTSNELHVGDVATLTLRVEHPIDGDLDVPQLGREDKSLLVRDTRKSVSALGNDRARTVYEIDFFSFVTGRHVVATNSIVFRQAGGETVEQVFPFLEYEVKSLLTEETQPVEPKPLASWPLSRWIYLLPVLLLLSLLGLVTYILLKRKPGQALMREPDAVPPDVRALARLEALVKRGYIEQGASDPFFVELSDIVRHYLEDRFNLHAPEQTTEEFLRTASQSRLLSDPHQQRTREFLEQSDLVKFAKWVPGRDVMEKALETSRTLILDTTPVREAAA